MRGEVTIELRTDRPDLRFYTGAVLSTEPDSRGPLTIESVRDHNGTYLLTFSGVHDRNKADTLRNTLLLADINPSESHESDDDFHLSEIVGCAILDENGRTRGEVIDVLPLPSQDTLVAVVEGEEVMIPFVKRFVPEVRIESRQIVVKDLEALL